MSPSDIRMDRLKTVGTLVMLCVIAVCTFLAFRRMHVEKNEIEVFPRYTVGEVIRSAYVLGPSPEQVILFTYQVGDSTYKGNGSGDVPDGQNRFLVKYSTQHPQYYKFYKRVPLLPTYIPPPDGWAEPPYPVPPEDLE